MKEDNTILLHLPLIPARHFCNFLLLHNPNYSWYLEIFLRVNALHLQDPDSPGISILLNNNFIVTVSIFVQKEIKIWLIDKKSFINNQHKIGE